MKNKQVESKIQKSFKFGAETYQNNAASLGKLTKAIKVTPARLAQAIDWLVSAAIEQTQWNQTAPLQQAATMLVFSDKTVLKKAGKKLLAYCEAELNTFELIPIKNSETVKVKYLVGTDDGERNLPSELPPFSGWEPAEGSKAPRAVTEKAVQSLQKAFSERFKYLLADEDTFDKADEERETYIHALIDALLDQVPATSLVKRLTDSEESINTLTKALELHKAELLEDQSQESDDVCLPDDSDKAKGDSVKLTSVEQEVERLKAKATPKPKATDEAKATPKPKATPNNALAQALTKAKAKATPKPKATDNVA